MTPGTPREPDTARRAGSRRVLVVLCAAGTTGWSVLSCAFPVLSGHITAATGWSTTAITAAFSAGQLVPALVGIPVGAGWTGVGLWGVGW